MPVGKLSAITVPPRAPALRAASIATFVYPRSITTATTSRPPAFSCLFMQCTSSSAADWVSSLCQRTPIPVIGTENAMPRPG